MYKNIINLLSATLEYYKTMPDSDTLSARDKYYITEGIIVAINSIKSREEFVVENLAYETLETTLNAVKDYVELEEVEKLVGKLYGETVEL